MKRRRAGLELAQGRGLGSDWMRRGWADRDAAVVGRLAAMLLARRLREGVRRGDVPGLVDGLAQCARDAARAGGGWSLARAYALAARLLRDGAP